MPEAMAIECPRCGAKVGEWCQPGESICHDRDHAWQDAGRPRFNTPVVICTHPSFDVDGKCPDCGEQVALAFPVDFAKRVADIDAGRWPRPKCVEGCGGDLDGAGKGLPFGRFGINGKGHGYCTKECADRGRSADGTDWRMALAWYMFHVLHEEGVSYAESHYRMSCMPAEYREAIRAIRLQLECMSAENGHLTKPDGSDW